MITKVTIKNFKALEEVVLELDKTVVFIGPNNSGKTSALQALALFEAGLRAWQSKRSDSKPSKRSGVTINRKDLIALSVPTANLLWRDLHVRRNIDGKTKNILIEILVEGVTNNISWICGFEFDYANPESFYCRPLRKDKDAKERYELPKKELISDIKVAFLPAMSGLASVESRIERGRINVLIGEGQTAQVLRNLCYEIFTEHPKRWKELSSQIEVLFGVKLKDPEYVAERGELLMSYKDRNGIVLDLSSAGRGLQQTLLLLAYLHLNPGAILLLDEPDAHLEILRQRQIYNILQQVSTQRSGQIIAASHSEVVLNEAIQTDTVVAFVGEPHVIKKSQQVLKALQRFGFENYYQAEEKQWVLYLEGSTDFSILKSFAKKLNHPVANYLETAFVYYVQNNSPSGAREHFYALREAYSSLKGIAIFDRISSELKTNDSLVELMWQKKEIENYIVNKRVLIDYVAGPVVDEIDLFLTQERQQRIETMENCIAEVVKAVQVMGKPSVWSDDIKSTDDFLIPLFKLYSEKLSVPILRKTRFFEIADLMTIDEIDDEITEKLDKILLIAQSVDEG